MRRAQPQANDIGMRTIAAANPGGQKPLYDFTNDVAARLFHLTNGSLFDDILHLSPTGREKIRHGIDRIYAFCGRNPPDWYNIGDQPAALRQVIADASVLSPDAKPFLEHVVEQDAHESQVRGFDVFYATLMFLYTVAVTFFLILRVDGVTNNYPFVLYSSLFLVGFAIELLFASLYTHSVRMNIQLVPSAREFFNWCCARAWLSATKWMFGLLMLNIGLTQVPNAANQWHYNGDNWWDFGWLGQFPYAFFSQFASYLLVINMFAGEMIAFLMALLKFIFRGRHKSAAWDNSLSATHGLIHMVDLMSRRKDKDKAKNPQQDFAEQYDPMKQLGKNVRAATITADDSIRSQIQNNNGVGWAGRENPLLMVE